MSRSSTLKTVEEIIKEARSSAEFISPEQAKLLLAKSDTLIIDVREPAEHNEACIPHSINIPRGVLEMKIASLAPTPEHEIIIHCATGGRASLSYHSLKSMGYNNVRVIDGAFDAIHSTCNC